MDFMKIIKRLLFVLLCFVAFSVRASSIAIVKDAPDNEELRQIITDIVSSIQKSYKGDVDVYDDDSINKIISGSYNAVIAVGDNSVKKLVMLKTNQDKYFIGPMYPMHNGYVFAYIPSPESVVEHLRDLFPSKNKVYIVSDKKYDWLDKEYKRYFKKYNFSTVFYYANDIKDAYENYQIIFKNVISKKDILLLNSNSVLDKELILPYILRKSWQKNVVVVSTKPRHVSYGVLMAFIPSNDSIGSEVTKCINNNTSCQKSINGFGVSKPLTNKRTYNHLNLNLDENKILFLEQ